MTHWRDDEPEAHCLGTAAVWCAWIAFWCAVIIAWIRFG